MTIKKIQDVDFGAELPTFTPDTSLANVRKFAILVGWNGPRFTSHEGARKEGLPGALVPGILSQGFLAAMIHRWAPDATIHRIDTVFRAPLLADEACTIKGLVTDVNEQTGHVEIDLTVANTAGETRVFGTASVELPTSV
jgi:acyl dehydratase